MCAKKLQRGMLSIIPTLQVLYRFRKRGMSLNFFLSQIYKSDKNDSKQSLYVDVYALNCYTWLQMHDHTISLCISHLISNERII